MLNRLTATVIENPNEIVIDGIDLLSKIGDRKKASPAQIARVWILARKPWMIRLPGTRKRERMDENIGAVAVELTPDDLGEIESAFSKTTVQGTRYPEHIERIE